MIAPPPTEGPLTVEELQLAAHNKGMPLEALRYDTTPVGLHYLLVHFDIPALDPLGWRLDLSGNVRQSLSLSLDDLRARPRRTMPVALECAGNGQARLDPRPISQPWLNEAVGTAEWTGTPLAGVLEEAGIESGTVEIVFTGADHGIEKGYEHDYARSLALEEATRPEVLLAYEMNGRPLEPQHGAPLRLLVPGWYGMAHVKWLVGIEALTPRFDGYQQSVAYWYRSGPDDPGEPVQRIRPRALLIPPGFPDFLTRRRTLDRGRVEIRGRAWSGMAPIRGVEIGVNGAWSPATLRESQGPFAWRVVVRVGGSAGGARIVVPCDGCRRQHSAAPAAVESAGDGKQSCAECPGYCAVMSLYSYGAAEMKSKPAGKLRDGAPCKVTGGVHAGKNGIVRDINTSKTGHVTITVVQPNGERFKTLAKNVVV